MIMGRMRLSAFAVGRASTWTKRVGFALSLGLVLGLSACQNTDDLLSPDDVPVEVMTAIFLPDSVLADNPIELNGEAIEREWGGPLDTDLPYVQIRMSREDGKGNPGEVKYISAKCIYSETDIYFLFQWVDDEASVMKDALYYTGPTNQGCDPAIVDPANWSFRNPLDPTAPDEEDRLDIFFTVPEGAGPTGKEDVWQWMATRTNPVRDLFDRETDNPNAPARGTPGYLEDAVLDSDPTFGLIYDPGTPAWRQNWAGDSAVPIQTYQFEDDQFFEPNNPRTCFNNYGEDCRVNNGLDFYYIWRDDLRLLPDAFEFCDSLNASPLPQGNDPRPWLFGDAITGYWYTYPTGSRADVHGRGVFDEGVWTLEAARKMFTGDLAFDLAFRRPVREDGQTRQVYVDRVPFRLRLYDNSQDEYWGSGPQVLLLGSREGAE